MKKQTVLLCTIFIYIFTYASTGPRLTGAMSGGGVNNAGTIMNYVVGDTAITGIFSFPTAAYASDPSGATLVETPDGLLYGISSYRGSSTVQDALFQFDYLSGTYTVRAKLDSTTGFHPFDLLHATNGRFYGAARYGGANNGGTLFSYTIGDTAVKKLYDFDALANPASSLTQGSDGNIYGETFSDGTNGGGVIFQYRLSDSSYHVLFNFPAQAYPGGLVEVGADTMYGMTYGGGANGGGTVIRYVIGQANDTVLYDLPANAHPEQKLLHASDGNLYGVTAGDGINSSGTIFSYNIATGIYTDVHDFFFGVTPQQPWPGELMQASDGNLYGLSQISGAYSDGYIYEYDLSNHTYYEKIDLSHSTGDPFYNFGHLIEYIPTAQLITTQPQGVTTCPGTTATFVSIDSGTIFGVQWQVSADSGHTYSNVNGATSDTLSFTALSSQNGYLYRALFTRTRGTDTSASALLSISPPVTDTTTGTVCPNDSFLFRSHVYYTPGTYSDTAHGVAAGGCDSIYVLALALSSGVVTPSVSISTGQSHTICYGTVITFTAHPTNGGTTPSYQWYVSGTPTGTASTFVDSTLQNTDSVWVEMKSSAACISVDSVMSNVIPYVVNPVVTPTVTISSTNTGDTICQNTVVNLLAVGTNGGSNADYQWQLNGVNVGNSNAYIADPVHNGDVYQCIITTTAPCATQLKDTSASITFTVNPYPVVAIISSSPTHTVCVGDSTLLTATGGSSYVWSNGDTTASLYSTGGTYDVTATSSYGCTAATAPVTLAPLPLTVDSIYQRGDSLVSGRSEFYQWYYDGNIISGAIGPVYVPGADGYYQVAIIDSNGCVDYSAVVLIAPAGISTITPSISVRMYPNPNSGIFTLELGDDVQHTAIITDATGRVVGEGTVTHSRQFDLSSLADGLYYLHTAGSVVKFTVVK